MCPDIIISMDSMDRDHKLVKKCFEEKVANART